MDRIKYFCYYDFQDVKKPREGVQAASSKIDYIIDAINRCDIKVDIISKSGISSKGFNLDFGGIHYKGINTLRHFFSFGCNGNVLRVLSRWLQNVHFFLWTLFNVKRHEEIIVYHSLGYCRLMCWIVRLKSCVIIGEIEEFYQDVHTYSSSLCRAEKQFINTCEKYMFPTAIMNTKFNLNHKKFIIVHGVYKQVTISEQKFQDGRIHVVYGGTFDPQKGGALAAAGIGRYLNEKYAIHICGFGSETDKAKIINIINDVNRHSESKTYFEGYLSGEQYAKFIQKCHVGLSTQNPSGAFNETSFPSKILVYMANGLDVVTVDIPVVRTSLVSNYLYFYKEQTSKSIADTIMNVKIGTQQHNKMLNVIDQQFVNEIKKIL